LNKSLFLESSVWILLIANLIPVFGVLFFDWDLYSIMVLFWMETAIIGFYQIIKILKVMLIFSIFLVPFFCVHFGGFMFGHFLFLTAFFGPPEFKHTFSPLPVLQNLLFHKGFWIPALALFLSHGYAFFKHDWNPNLSPFSTTVPDPSANPPSPTQTTDYHPMEDWRAELRPTIQTISGPKQITLSPKTQALVMWVAKRSVNPGRQDLMAEPYKRVVIMHVTIIFGAFLTFIFGTTKFVILLLIGLKIASDLFSHVHYHGLAGTRKGLEGMIQA